MAISPYLLRLLGGGQTLLGGTGGIAGGGTYPPAWSTPPFNPNAAPAGVPMGGPVPGPMPGGSGGFNPNYTGPAPLGRALAPPKGPKWLQALGRGVNKGVSALAGPGNPNLTPQEQEAQRQYQMRIMAGALLAGSGPKPQGTQGLFEPFGNAMLAGQQAGQQFSADAIRARMMQAQMAQAQQQQVPDDPADVRTLRAAGIDPASPEGREILVKSISGGGSVSDQLAAIQAQLAIDERRDRIERERTADARTAEENRVKKAQLGNTLKGGITQTADLAALTQQLEGSFLEAGMPASSWRRTGAAALAGVGGALGMDVGKLEHDIAQFDKLKKGLSDQLISLMSTGDLGAGTNSKLQQYQNALATTETSPGAIMSIQAGIAQALLDEADIQGIEIKGRDVVEANIEKWRHYESPAEEPVVDVPGAITDFSKMTDEQLKRIIDGK